MAKNILIVDDDPQIISSFMRNFQQKYDIYTALYGDQGLDTAISHGPFALVISDYRMPGMDGIQFLTKMKQISPDTVRILLTGYADLQIAIDAINEGNIFRFLSKPVDPETLGKVIETGLRQNQLVTAERDLLEKTLNSSVTVLVEILGLVNPVLFSKSSRVKKIVRFLSIELGLKDGWQYELAAMLSQIGNVAIPGEQVGVRGLSQSTNRMFLSDHSIIGKKLLENIPRMENIAQMIGNQTKPFLAYRQDMVGPLQSSIDIGAQMLKASSDFDDLLLTNRNKLEAISEMEKSTSEYNPRLLKILEKYQPEDNLGYRKLIDVDALEIGMVSDEDIYSSKGNLLLNQGQTITYAVIERLRNFKIYTGIKEPFYVFLPKR